MRKVFVIGIGTGNPEHITLQAVAALNQVDAFFVMDKGEVKADLVQLRKLICERYIRDHAYRIIEIPDPVRDPAEPSYTNRVEGWHEQRAVLYERALASQLGEGECGGFLVWGDPALYDSTLRILDRVAARGSVAFEYEVLPGISAVQLLAARHRIALNRIAGAIHITTGRNLARDFAELADTTANIVVMLDGELACKQIDPSGVQIYWGAYLGSEAEILVAGQLSECLTEIEQLRRSARAKHGWIMDTYLLRRA
jgi:precorrin-6A synthase